MFCFTCILQNRTFGYKLQGLMSELTLLNMKKDTHSFYISKHISLQPVYFIIVLIKPHITHNGKLVTEATLTQDHHS